MPLVLSTYRLLFDSALLAKKCCNSITDMIKGHSFIIDQKAACLTMPNYVSCWSTRAACHCVSLEGEEMLEGICRGLLPSSTFQDTFLQKSCILSIEGAYVILQSPIDIRIPGADRRIGPSPPSPPAAVRCRNCTQWHMGLKLEGRKNGAWGPRKQTLSLSLLRRRFIVLRRTT